MKLIDSNFKSLYFAAIILLFGFSCAKKNNEKLYEESKASSLSFYKNKDTLLAPKGGSPHGNFKLKLNSTALKALDAMGELPAGAKFENGSLIVKEVFKGNELEMYAIMKKDPTSKYASQGWVWAEYGPSGNVIYNASKNGKACISCHSASNNRDATTFFDLH